MSQQTYKDQELTDTLHRAIRDCSSILRQHKNTIADTHIHLQREIVGDIVTWAHASGEDNVAVLLDQAGMGKTVVMRDVLEALELQEQNVLAIKADQQFSGIVHYADVQERLHLSEPLEELVNRLTVTERVTILLDQIDALSMSLARDQSALNVALELVARLRGIPGVRILFSCRTFDYNSDPRLRKVDVKKQFLLLPLSDDEIRKVLAHLHVDYDTLLPVTRQLLRVPLHLDLFARAVAGHLQEARLSHPVATLQDLYSLLWRTVITADGIDGPAISDREEVLQRMVAHMDKEQCTSAPQGMFATSETEHLQRAVHWLASAGILLSGPTEWSFLHQTFFDYCYAKQFVDNGGKLTETIQSGNQGLHARSQLVQVLAYLRGSNETSYLREVSSLLSAPGLRLHLHELLLRWFGSITNPTDGEWLIAYRRVVDPATRSQFLLAFYGSPGWFARLRGTPIQDLLAQEDGVIDTQVVPYLRSLLEIAQGDIVSIVRPFLSRSDRWNDRLAGMILTIYHWHTDEALALLEELLHIHPTLYARCVHELNNVARAHPDRGSRLIGLVLDRLLDTYLAEQAANHALHIYNFPSALETLNGSSIEQLLEAAIDADANLLVQTMIPWLERVVTLTPHDEGASPYYTADGLSSNWRDTIYVVQHQLIQAFTRALSVLALTDAVLFSQATLRLGRLPYQTPHQLLAWVYSTVPDRYATEALRFLLADKRRLNLGDHQQFESRQLISAICPYLTDLERIRLEEFITTYNHIWGYRGITGLEMRGLDQLYLFQALPGGCLSDKARRCFAELQRKFPNTQASPKPIVIRSGFVGSPISGQVLQHMSDRAWLRAMSKYSGNRSHHDFLKGGARELSGALVERTKQEPERFFRLGMQQVPIDVDEAYVTALFSGLAQADCPADWLFAVVRRFALRQENNIRSGICWHLKSRVEAGLPEDLTRLLEEYVRSSMEEDEIQWMERNEQRLSSHGSLNDGPYHSYLNSLRGSALSTLMRALDKDGSQGSIGRRWLLLEFVAGDPSIALRAGAIEELLYVLNQDPERSVNLFQTLMVGHLELLHTHFAQEFLYHAMNKHFTRVLPFVRALMEEESDQCQQRGAELICLASISPLALTSAEEQRQADVLTAEASVGRVTWRRGVARIYRHNMTGAQKTKCLENLKLFTRDDDSIVQGIIGSIFSDLRGEHVFSLRPFIEDIVASPSLYAGTDEFSKFMLEYGSLDPAWALAIVKKGLGNMRQSTERSHFAGGAELVRLVLSIHTDQTVEHSLRGEAMQVFDMLMEIYRGQAQMALNDWDTR